mmetsp:Transcript_14509/g.47664  ORF Transcript_14509/g.47664 Transcript_14509/m.47664 type:complete len:202 (-) Transcript_14509:517-1122(-)
MAKPPRGTSPPRPPLAEAEQERERERERGRLWRERRTTRAPWTRASARFLGAISWWTAPAAACGGSSSTSAPSRARAPTAPNSRRSFSAAASRRAASRARPLGPRLCPSRSFGRCCRSARRSPRSAASLTSCATPRRKRWRQRSRDPPREEPPAPAPRPPPPPPQTPPPPTPPLPPPPLSLAPWSAIRAPARTRRCPSLAP